MSSRTPRPPGRHTIPAEPEDSYPHVPQPRQGHTGYALAFLSVIAVLGFGLWAAIGTLTGPGEKPTAMAATTASPTQMATRAATAAPTSTPTGAAGTPSRSGTASAAGERVHVVGQGDTLYRIARLYGTTVEAIMEANGIVDRSQILHIGDRLIIP